MEQIILVVHLLTALAIIGLIMLQQGKGADMGASFGAGASQTLFGTDGSGSVLTKATTLLAVGFFVTSFALAIVAKEKASAVVDGDITLPIMQQEVPAMEADIPAVDEDIPAGMSAADDEIPGVE